MWVTKTDKNDGKMNGPLDEVIFARLECSPLTLPLRANSTPFHVWNTSLGVGCISMQWCYQEETLHEHNKINKKLASGLPKKVEDKENLVRTLPS